LKPFTAIAALAENRVIGDHGRIPWHLPDDFRFFKQTTMGHVLVMGRRTFESIGRPLPGRHTIVVSRTVRELPGVEVVPSLDAVDGAQDARTFFLCGGGELYRAGLPRCETLLLTHVHRAVEGDATFPEYAAEFEPEWTLLEHPDFHIVRYRRRGPA
jgi:dihydrofolate reductase